MAGKGVTTPFTGRMNADLQPHLVGELIELRPLREADWEPLFQIAADSLLWKQHPNHNRHEADVFRKFFNEAIHSGGALVAIDRRAQRIIGSSRFSWYDTKQLTIEIGWTFLARDCWGGRHNGEMKRLMLQHAFTFARRVVFVIGPDNVRSRRAIERLGAVLTPDREKGTDAEGRAVDLVVFEIVNPGSQP
jgi:RimJ/RimL family protein N-acetyltransferase